MFIFCDKCYLFFCLPFRKTWNFFRISFSCSSCLFFFSNSLILYSLSTLGLPEPLNASSPNLSYSLSQRYTVYSVIPRLDDTSVIRFPSSMTCLIVCSLYSLLNVLLPRVCPSLARVLFFTSDLIVLLSSLQCQI